MISASPTMIELWGGLILLAIFVVFWKGGRFQRRPEYSIPRKQPIGARRSRSAPADFADEGFGGA